MFLVGAYQEILGDLHNLFGDTHAVHVSLDEGGNVVLDAVIKGDTVKEVLDYVEFDAETLVRKLRNDVELAVREGSISYEESGRLLEFYEEGLQGYTYLEEPEENASRRPLPAFRSEWFRPSDLCPSGQLDSDAVLISQATFRASP